MLSFKIELVIIIYLATTHLQLTYSNRSKVHKPTEGESEGCNTNKEAKIAQNWPALKTYDDS